VVNAVTNIGSSALPVCMGVSVLKYRLYELVLLATHLLPHKSAVAVAVSTLVTAALFAPVRRRVQRVVDRRFNRSRYDAEAVVAAFTARLRHTVDLEAVRHDLLGVTDDVFKPAHVSVWLAPAPAPAPPR
jgi:MFS superfamily sulfate permease-like transporter